MKTFARVILINLGVYTVYMLLFVATHSEIVGAPVILLHAIVLFVVSGMRRNPAPMVSAEAPSQSELENYDRVRQIKQAYIVSGLLILLIGMPLCFVIGAQGFNVQ
jgi:hypothetical protein